MLDQQEESKTPEPYYRLQGKLGLLDDKSEGTPLLLAATRDSG